MDLLIEMPHGYETVIDKRDWRLIKSCKLYVQTNGYVYFASGPEKGHTLHGFLVPAPKGFHTDHEDGDILNNRRSNLRVVTHQKNQINRKRLNRNNSTGVRGVGYYPHLYKKPWQVQIMVDGKNRSRLFATKEEAIEYRKAAELEHYGELCPVGGE